MNGTGLRWLVVALVVFGAIAAGPAMAQGRSDYFNVESPQVHPIEVARMGGHDYLLIANTADNSVELWDTDENNMGLPRFIRRIPVGLEPVSVRFFPETNTAAVANFLGDSVTGIVFNNPAPDPTISYILTEQSVDEPMDVAFGGTARPQYFTSHLTLDALRHSDILLQPLAGFEEFPATATFNGDLNADGMSPDTIALKEPRTALYRCNKLFVLGTKGGNTVHYDMDLYIYDFASGTSSFLAGLGSVNYNMAFDANDNLYVVGGEAQNHLRGEAAVAAAPTGFVENTVYLVEGACGTNPTVKRRDVNVGQSIPLAQLTDVAIYERANLPTKLFLPAFASNRIGVVEPSTTTLPSNWPIRGMAMSLPAGVYHGPRGAALKYKTTRQNDPGDRLYVLNRVSETVTIYDPATEQELVNFSLNNQVTPSYITAGRRFIYSSEFSSNQLGSCGGCHTDSRLDGKAWDLSDNSSQIIPENLKAFPTRPPAGTLPVEEWARDKLDMVTQTLQGLLNWDVEREMEDLVSNAPYHWRGDRPDLPAFNGAFLNLFQGNGLNATQLDQMTDFVNSISYPPNPKQPKNRLYSGSVGQVADAGSTGEASGSGALKGQKLYHIHTGERCSGCHALPEGSDNIITEGTTGVSAHPVFADPRNHLPTPGRLMETAALRMLFQKEARRDLDGTSIPGQSPITGFEGMTHTGLFEPRPVGADFHSMGSINSFNEIFVGLDVGGNCSAAGGFGPACGICNNTNLRCGNLDSLNQYIHEFDSGTAPMVGNVITVTPNNQATVDMLIAEAEQQAELGNAGLVVHAWIGGTMLGFYYDVTTDATCGVPAEPCRYRDETNNLTLNRTQLRTLAASQFNETRVFMSVPLGVERRAADPTGTPSVLNGTPTNVTLQRMPTNTANQFVPLLPYISLISGAESRLERTIKTYKGGIFLNPILPGPINPGPCPTSSFVPRRLRVSGDGILPGAKLHLFVPTTSAPNTSGPPSAQEREIVLPIYPTAARDANNRVVWETAVELEPLLYFRLMAGRPIQPQYSNIMVNLMERDIYGEFAFNDIFAPGHFNPTIWNNHYVRIENAGGGRGDFGWQRMLTESPLFCP